MHWVVMDLGEKKVLKGWFAYDVESILRLYGECVRLVFTLEGKRVFPKRARQKK